MACSTSLKAGALLVLPYSRLEIIESYSINAAFSALSAFGFMNDFVADNVDSISNTEMFSEASDFSDTETGPEVCDVCKECV